MGFVQVAVRRNGLHAVRGWCLNQLEICPGKDSALCGNKLEGESWFSWTVLRYTVQQLVDLAQDKPFVTLESFPLPMVLDFVNQTKSTLILHTRSFANWVCSSIVLERKRDGAVCVPFLNECIGIWLGYVDYAAEQREGEVVFSYDEWFKSREYRQYIARKLGVVCDGEPYRRVHGMEYSSFDGNKLDGKADEMFVLNRYKSMQEDPDFQEAFRIRERYEKNGDFPRFVNVQPQ